jgi:hypothetical protein
VSSTTALVTVFFVCGVKLTVSEKSPFNEQVCGAEAKHTLHACEALR